MNVLRDYNEVTAGKLPQHLGALDKGTIKFLSNELDLGSVPQGRLVLRLIVFSNVIFLCPSSQQPNPRRGMETRRRSWLYTLWVCGKDVGWWGVGWGGNDNAGFTAPPISLGCVECDSHHFGAKIFNSPVQASFGYALLEKPPHWINAPVHLLCPCWAAAHSGRQTSQVWARLQGETHGPQAQWCWWPWSGCSLQPVFPASSLFPWEQGPCWGVGLVPCSRPALRLTRDLTFLVMHSLSCNLKLASLVPPPPQYFNILSSLFKNSFFFKDVLGLECASHIQHKIPIMDK